MQPYAKTPSIPSAQNILAPMQNALDPASMAITLPPEMTGDTLAMLPEAVFDLGGGFIGAEDESAEGDEYDFTANLAEKIDDDILEALGSELVSAVESDKETRAAHNEKYVKGITALGINFDPEAAQSEIFGNINHPLLIEAATQFQARAMAELYPAEGPVKTKIAGENSRELMEQAGRVQDYMNYQLVHDDPTYYPERDQMLFTLPFTGSEFDKQYYDKNLGKVVSRWVRYDDMIIHYGATCFENCPRYTHVLHLELNDIKRLQLNGHYKEGVDFTEDEAATEISVIGEKLAKVDGVELQGDESATSVRDLYEIHIEYNLAGFEDQEGINLPYIITVDKTSKRVLSIYRNWKEDDERRIKRVWFTHKKFLPGFGFYGFGLFHTIGSLGEVATKIMQLLLDAGAFSALQGGFKTKDAKLGGSIEIAPGVWQDVELTAEELSKAFWTPPFKEPSGTLFNLLGAVVELGRRFASTTEVMVGDAATTGPVGTTVALVEQGSKVFSGIHRRLHNAIGLELQHMADLNGEQLEDAEYPYNVRGATKEIFKQDFDGRVDIIPVSDPNIVSNAQRISMAQAVFQLATQMPDIADRREAAYSLLTAMRIPDYEAIFPPEKEAERTDPVSEIAIAMMGRPLKAYLDQDHGSHITVHMGALQMGTVMPQIAPAIQAHIAEHMAMKLVMDMQQAMQMPMQPLAWGAKPRESLTQPLPPEQENMVAMRAAQAMQQMMQQMMQAQQAQQGQGQQGQGGDGGQTQLAAAQITAQTQKEIAGMAAQTKQQEMGLKAQMQQSKDAQKQNEFMAEMALRHEEFKHQQNMDVATFRKEMDDRQQQTMAAVQAMVAEVKHELALKAAQNTGKE